MKNLFIISLAMLFAGCTKDAVKAPPERLHSGVKDTIPLYTRYSIATGTHYCDRSTITVFAGDHISFKVKFDSTAMYNTVSPANQADINKLYGFSEGIENHLNRARIGWSWNNNALRLYAYVYAAGVRSSREISTVVSGAAIACTIRIWGNQYLFSVGGHEVALPRSLNTATVSGYMQYPYFGGDEVAPHNIYIYMLDL